MLSAYLFKKKAVGSRQQATGGGRHGDAETDPPPTLPTGREIPRTQNPEPSTQNSTQTGCRTQHSALYTRHHLHHLPWIPKLVLSHRKVVGVGVLSLLAAWPWSH